MISRRSFVAGGMAAQVRAEDFAAAQMRKFGIPGMCVAVVRRGEVVVNRAYGLASVELNVAATTASVFQIASVTKIFAATAVMLLRVELEAPITEFFPGFPAKWRPIRVRHLLDHTSGLPSAESIAAAGEMPLKFAPGEKFSYNQTGYIIAGMLVEKLAGKTFPEFLKARVFDPLGMTSCRFGDSRVVVPGRPAAAYSRQEGGELRNWIWRLTTRGIIRRRV